MPPLSTLTPSTIADIAVVGAGLAGLATALACVPRASVTLLDAGTLEGCGDTRASFLSTSSQRLLNRLGVWVESQPVVSMDVGEGEAGRPLRGTPLVFGGNGELGAVVENAALHTTLVSAVRASDVEVRGGVHVDDHAVEGGTAVL